MEDDETIKLAIAHLETTLFHLRSLLSKEEVESDEGELTSEYIPTGTDY